MARSNSRQLAIPDAAAQAPPLIRPSAFRAVLISLRPHQWSKNAFVFAALIFAQRLFDPRAVATSVAAFLVFCALSGAVYLVNDIADRKADQLHPLKRMRPIAAGTLSVPTAAAVAVVLGTL